MTTNNNFRIKNALEFSDSSVQTSAFTGTIAYSQIQDPPSAGGSTNTFTTVNLDGITLANNSGTFSATKVIEVAVYPCALLLTGEDGNGSSTFTDSSAHAHTPDLVVGAYTSNAYSKFGSGSIYIGGTGSRISYGTSSDFDWTTSDWTIDLWLLIPESWDGYGFVKMVGMPDNFFAIAYNGNMYLQTGTGVDAWSYGSLSFGEWHHVAIQKHQDSNTLSAWFDGTPLSATDVGSGYNLSWSAGSHNILIGNFDGSQATTAYLDNVRITRSLLWTDGQSFTPPTESDYSVGSNVTYTTINALPQTTATSQLTNDSGFITSTLTATLSVNNQTLNNVHQIDFNDESTQTTAWTGTVAFSSVTDVPSFSTATSVSQLTNDSEYLTSSTVGTYIPSVTPTVQYWTTGTISTASTTTALIALVQDSGMDSASTTSTNNIPAFYDGSAWRYVFNLEPVSVATSGGGGMDTNTILLLHAEDFTDSAGNFTLSTAGNISISSDQAKFGESFYFDGSGGQINLAYNAIQEFEAQDFTIEYWLYRNSGTAAGVVPIAGWGGGAGGHSWFIRDGDGGYFIWVDSDGNQTNYNLGMDTTTGVWRHYAMVRNGNTFTAYQDGTQIYTNTMNGSVHTESGTGLFLGYNADAPSNGYFFLNGYIDEVRISKGIARYTANFTPPTSAFTS